MKNINWTPQQKRAIEHKASNILVTASAGTGKTAVLSGRCVNILADKRVRPDVWNMLVLTFTDAAAEQMRSRIAEQLRAAYLQTKDAYLREQLVLLNGADISTIHSFCKKLITEYFYKLDIDPAFSIIDEDEQRLLKADILGQTIDWAWEQGLFDNDLKELLYKRNVGQGDDFLNNVIHISDFLETIVGPNEWLDKALLSVQPNNAGQNDIYEKQKLLAVKKINGAVNLIKGCINIHRKISSDPQWPSQISQTCIEPLENILTFIKENSPKELGDILKKFDKPRINTPKNLENDKIAKLLQKTIKQAVDEIEKINELAVFNGDCSKKTGASFSRQISILIELVRKFRSLYSLAKKQLNRMDFADLEHFALELLKDNPELKDDAAASDTITMLRNKYKYIFVDEYQDINNVQKAILDLLSKNSNLFVVGDIKQSIYAFRGAKPSIFAKELEETKDFAEITKARVDLNNNFRSAQELLDFVNLVFSRIMKKDVALIDYDDSANLRGSLNTQKQITEFKGKRIELHILADTPQEDNDEDIEESAERQDDSYLTTSRQRQAALIAKRIKQIIGEDKNKSEFEIYDPKDGCCRSVEYRDIVILMRSVSKRADSYVEILQLAGIPVNCDTAAGYFETTEIKDCLSLLKVLDNPRRDIEFAALVRGPAFKISDTDLLKIRLFAKNNGLNKSFFDCAALYSRSGTDKSLADKLTDVLKTIERWRNDARYEKLPDLIWRIFYEKDLPAFYCAMPNGKNRKANLLKLHERAMQFESFASNSGSFSLDRFIAFIEKLQESETEWAAAESQGTNSNAVRIMSIHKSKGLEYPVVFLAELESKFNTKDEHLQVLVNEKDGVGLKLIDPRTNVISDSASYQIIAADRQMENLAEEMRILYVAMTRAREKLILTACKNTNDCSDILAQGFLFGQNQALAGSLLNHKNFIDWILFGLSSYDIMHRNFETGLAAGLKNNIDGFDLTVHRNNELNELSEYIYPIGRKKKSICNNEEKTPAGIKKTADILASVKCFLNQKYKYSYAVSLPSKQSVTNLAHKNDKFYSQTSLLLRPSAAIDDGTPNVTDKLNIGTAAHSVIAEINLDKPVNIESIRNTVESMVKQRYINHITAGKITIKAIESFFKSDIGKTALDKNNFVKREWPFTFAVDIDNGEKMIVQGIIDMLIKTPKGLVIIDFKTDRIPPAQLEERVAIYQTQLQLYANAAEAILKSTLESAWLYFLELEKFVKI